MNEDIKLITKKAQYKDKYRVLALFENNNKYRRFADIVRVGYEECDIDAYIIMINPGSCRPGNEPKKEIQFYKKYKNNKDNKITEATADMAQKCVMTLMEYCNMNKIRILNLIDLANGNLEQVLEKKNEWGNSIFSKEREEDLAKYMPNDAVCLAAWGTSNIKELRKRKEEAYNRIGKDRIIGYVADKKKKYSYYYIKPRGADNQIKVIKKIAKEYMEYINENM